MKTKITQLFGIQLPVMLAGMMWLAKPELCAAISNTGGLANLATRILAKEATYGV